LLISFLEHLMWSYRSYKSVRYYPCFQSLIHRIGKEAEEIISKVAYSFYPLFKKNVFH
jgi:hypothetical protein